MRNKIEILAFLVFGLVSACSNPSAEVPRTCSQGGTFCNTSNRTPKPPPAAPRIEPLAATSLPYLLIPIRGTAIGDRVIIENARTSQNPIINDVVGISFCVDLRLPENAGPGSYEYKVYAQDISGQRSTSPSMVQFQYDPNASYVEGMQTCRGVDPKECRSKEVCDNGLDDDCNGARDVADAACTPACINDNLEPNDFAPGHSIETTKGYEGMLCQGDRDVYSFQASNGSTIVVHLSSANLSSNLVAVLYDSANNELVRQVISGNTLTFAYPPDDRGLQESGEFRVAVFGVSQTVSGNYTVQIDLEWRKPPDPPPIEP